MRRWGGWLIVGVVGVLAVSGGWAFAATISSSGVIHACSAKHGGALRLAGNCKHNERPVSWNVQGTPGKNGTNGANGTSGTNGTTGQPGPRGPAAIRVTTALGPNPITPGQAIVSQDLSSAGAASYLAIATIDLNVLGGSSAYGVCTLATTGGGATAAQDRTIVYGGTPDERLALQVPVVSASGGTYGVSLTCSPGPASALDRQYVTLSTTQTDTMTVTAT